MIKKVLRINDFTWPTSRNKSTTWRGENVLFNFTVFFFFFNKKIAAKKWTPTVLMIFVRKISKLKEPEIKTKKLKILIKYLF